MAYCCVPFCKSKFKKKTGTSFHEFPCNEIQRSAWLRAICRKNFYPTDTSNYSRVCGLHFKKEDYKPNLKFRILKPTAVPTIFPGYPSWHKVAPLPKVVHKKSLTFQNRQLGAGESNSSMLMECKRQETVRADVNNANNALSKICTKFNVQNSKIVNFKNLQSQTKAKKSLKKLKETRNLKKLLYFKNKQIVCLKQKVATLNGNPGCSFASGEEMQFLEIGGSPEKSLNEPQKILFISSGSNNVRIDETDMETILKAMNGEDITSKNDESSASALSLNNTVIEHSDTDHTGNDESRSNDATSETPLKILSVSGNTENSKNESQKTLFPTSGTNNICVDEAGLETILDTQIEQSDVDHAEIERNQSCSNTAMSEITLQISDVQGSTSPNPEVNHQYTTSNLAVKEKADDVKQLQSATENFFLITEEPKQVVELKTCNSKKDEFDLYAELLANKLRNMDEQFRKEVTNQIDKMISKKGAEYFEGQQDPENCGTD